MCVSVCVCECKWGLLVHVSLANPQIGLDLADRQCPRLKSEAGDASCTAYLF